MLTMSIFHVLTMSTKRKIMKSTGRQAHQLRLRLSQELLEFIRDQAERNHRSMTAEINFRLLQSKERDDKEATCK